MSDRKKDNALRACIAELERLRDLYLPTYEGKIGEPDKRVIDRAKRALVKEDA